MSVFTKSKPKEPKLTCDETVLYLLSNGSPITKSELLTYNASHRRFTLDSVNDSLIKLEQLGLIRGELSGDNGKKRIMIHKLDTKL